MSKRPLESLHSLLLETYPEVGVLESRGTLCLSFEEFSYHLSKQLCHVTLATAMHEGSDFTTSPPRLFYFFVYVYVFGNSHPNDIERYVVVVLTGISLMSRDVEHLFACLLALCVSSSEKCLCMPFIRF